MFGKGGPCTCGCMEKCIHVPGICIPHRKTRLSGCGSWFLYDGMHFACNCPVGSPVRLKCLSPNPRVPRSPVFTQPTAKAGNLQREQPLSTVPNGLITRVVSAATGILRIRSPSQSNSEADVPVTRLAAGDIDGVLSHITEDFNQRAYFITGDISDTIYASQCYFADPTVQFSGLARWKQNLQLLVPFLINPKIELLDLQAEHSKQEALSNVPPKLKAAWTLQTSLKLPWHPFLDVIGATEYVLNSEANQVVSHVESWNITPWEAIKQVLTPGKAT